MSWINRKVFPGQYADARVLGEGYAFNGPAGVHTSEGVKPPTGTDYLMFLRVSPVGPLKVVGKQHTGTDAIEWDGTSWKNQGVAFGNRPVAYDRAGNLHVVRGPNEPSGSIGIRYFNDMDQPVYSFESYADQVNQVYEYTDKGGVRIGQSGVGGAVAVIDGKRYLIEPGDTQMINVDRQGDHFAISMTKFAEGTVVIIQTTLEEILHQPLQELGGPVVIPPPMKPEHGDVVVKLAQEHPFDKSSIESIFNFTRRVAWALQGDGCGLLQKPGGENIISYQGDSYSISRVCYPNGQIFKILSDAGPGGQNGPQWADDGTVDANRYRKALPPDDGGVVVPPPDDPKPEVTKEDLEVIAKGLDDLEMSFAGFYEDFVKLRDRVAALESKPEKPFPKLACKGKSEKTWGHQHEINLEVKVVE